MLLENARLTRLGLKVNGPEQTACSSKLLAKLLNVSERRVRQLAASGVVVRLGRGQYELSSGLHGYIGYLKGQPKKSQEHPAQIQVMTKLLALSEQIHRLEKQLFEFTEKWKNNASPFK